MPKAKTSPRETNTRMNMEKIKAALKQTLRQRGLNYKQVAELWQCSEPTVKRLLGSEELPLSRLLTLLDYLGLSLQELHKLCVMESLEQPVWTLKQNEFLAKNPKLFAFLMKLYEPGATPQSIARKYKIAGQELEKILIQLEKYDLIRIGKRGAVKPYYERIPNLDGRLGAQHTSRLLDHMNRYFKSNINDSLARQLRGLERDNGHLSFMIYEITEKTFLEFKERTERLSRELESTAKIEESLYPKSKLKSCVNMIGMFLERTKSPALTILEDSFGEDLIAN